MKLIPPATGWQRKKSGLAGGELFVPLSGIALVLVSLVVCSYFLMKIPQHRGVIFSLQLIIFLWGALLLYISQARIKQNLLIPLSDLRNWALRMRGGNLSAQIPVPAHGVFAELARDINDLGESLRSLTREMDQKVDEQTQRLEQKTRSLETLYQVAASSNTARDLKELLLRHLDMLTHILQAKFATVRLINDDHQLQLIGTTGISMEKLSSKRLVPLERCLCALNFQKNVIQCDSNESLCGNILGSALTNIEQKINVIALPLQYQNTTLGIYNFFLEQDVDDDDNETRDILTNIGQHLSLAIEKARLEDESKRVTIMQERTMLAHELHDSLAQTLASLRFRINLLEKTLRQNNNPDAQEEAAHIRNGLDEANSKLRELLAHFRVRMDERGLIPAIENLTTRFESETGIAVFFQNECTEMKLPPDIEIQVLHIIQESLTNIRKHSKAENVRVLIRCNQHSRYHVLIEDDGIGIETNQHHGQPGEHVGMKIMQERAKRINGNLSVDSEAGEGTRIELDFDASNKPDDNNSRSGALAANTP